MEDTPAGRVAGGDRERVGAETENSVFARGRDAALPQMALIAAAQEPSVPGTEVPAIVVGVVYVGIFFDVYGFPVVDLMAGMLDWVMRKCRRKGEGEGLTSWNWRIGWFRPSSPLPTLPATPPAPVNWTL